jgi:two-component system CheB/CheR fusion protein
VHDVQITPLVGADGNYLGVGIAFVEVTEYKQLQEEVEHSKRDVETAYEELQSTVEELETTNEELQSTNEELETMNEELQSTNEELETINDELSLRTEELNQANVFLESILRSVDGGMVVLDEELRVLAWNAGAEDLWGLRADEVASQHFMNLDIGFPVDRLHPGLRRTLAGEGVEPLVVEATNRRGRPVVLTVRMTPLVAQNGGTRGAIVLMETAAA